MMMTLQQYKNLSEEQQIYFLARKGVIVSTLHRGNEIYTLLQIYGFYVELFNYLKAGPISSINCFEETELLEPYLKTIDISSVYKVLNLEK